MEWYRWEMSEWEKCRQEQVAGNVQWKQSSPQDIHLNIACLQYEEKKWPGEILSFMALTSY